MTRSVFSAFILSIFVSISAGSEGQIRSLDLAASHVAPLNIPLNQAIQIDVSEYGSHLYIDQITVSGILNTYGGSWANDVGFYFRSDGQVSYTESILPALGLFQNGNGISVGPTTRNLDTGMTVSDTGLIVVTLYDTSYDVANQPDATWQSGSIEIRLNSCLPADTAEPYGTLDFFDVSLFIEQFTSQDDDADINNDGNFDFFDISTFLVAYGDGCK